MIGRQKNHKGMVSIHSLNINFVILCANLSVLYSSQDVDKKNKLDPLAKMNAFLDQTKQSELQKKEKRKKEKKHHKVSENHK